LPTIVPICSRVNTVWQLTTTLKWWICSCSSSAAVWSFQLALRARGIGSTLTTVHICYEREVATLLNIPQDFTQAALLAVAYFMGDDFRPAKRLPASTHIHWNGWVDNLARPYRI
jgi:hypothetical protein